MKKTKITFGKIGVIGTGTQSSSQCLEPTNVESTLDQSGFGSFGRAANSSVPIEEEAVTNDPPEEQPSNDQDTRDVAAAMGFGGFGKKAREFDLEKLAEQTRLEAMERNKCNIDKLTLSSVEDDGEDVGPSLPTGMASSHSSQEDENSDGDDEDEIVGPPLPPDMLQQLKNASGKRSSSKKALGARDDDSGSEDDGDGYKLPVSHELPLTHGEKAVTAVSMDPSGSRLVSGSIDYDVKYWDFQGMDLTREAFRTFCPHDGYPINAVDYSCTGDKVLAVSGSSQTKVYDRDGILLFECAKGDMYIQDMGRTKGHVSSITDACWHPKDKEEFLTSSRDGTCRIWHSSKPSCQKHVIKPRAVNGLKAKPTSCCYSRDGLTVACAGDDGSVQMWDHRKSYVNTIVNVKDCHTRGTDTSSICFSYDNKYYATRGMDDTLKLWDMRKPKAAVFAANGLFNRFDMTDCLFSPNDQLVVTGTSMNKGETSGKLVMFNRNTWELEHHMDVGTSHVVSLAWHPRLNQICVGCGDGKVRLFYDPTLSRNGAVLAAGKRKKRPKDSGVVVSQQIITPHALPLFREERHKSTRKLELRDRKDPVKSHRPDLPLGSSGTGGRVTSGGSTLSSYIIRNLGLQNKKMEDDEGDPREALLKFDKLAKEDPYWVSPAYAATQPKPVFRETEEDLAAQQKAKKQKTDE